MSSKHIYLATPYSHPDEQARTERFMAVSRRASRLMQQGHLIGAGRRMISGLMSTRKRHDG